ncbi:ABC transporter permease [Ruania alkalisoli]|uniref:ABC transporter permease n=1 Tax=Ruania alkalisoli TaxID=2779775 RepID=A0A7M1SZ82_9MICO|nr:ABC transporter permease [Ruania alkalisoli]
MALVFVVLTVIFLAIHAVPGDPAYQLAGGDTGTTTEGIERIRRELGLDRPLHVQYGDYLAGFLQGDLGTSFVNGQPVLGSILQRLPATLELIGWGGLLSVGIGLPLGALAARRRGVDVLMSLGTSLALAVPVYVLGALLVLVFAVTLRVLPAGGFAEWSQPARHLQSLLLPVLTLSAAFGAIVARMTRASVAETLDRDWVRTAVALGVAPRTVFRRHVLRNSLMPVITVVGLEVGTFLGSSVIIERVFNYPGLSSLLVDGVTSRDYPVVQGVVIVVSVLFVLINMLVEICYGLLDPRVRLS